MSKQYQQGRQIFNKAIREDMWFLDSGCSNHMCGKKKYFSDFDGSFKDSVKLGNNSSMVVTGKGNVRLQVNEIIMIITGVFYVPDLRNNLLSIGKLQAKGVTFLFQNGTCKGFHPERGLIMKTKMSLNRMFVLHAISQPVAAVQTQLKFMGRSGSRSLSYTHRSNFYRHSRRSRRDPSPSPYHSTTRSRRSSRSSSLIHQRRKKFKKEEKEKKRREAELKKLEES